MNVTTFKRQKYPDKSFQTTIKEEPSHREDDQEHDYGDDGYGGDGFVVVDESGSSIHDIGGNKNNDLTSQAMEEQESSFVCSSLDNPKYDVSSKDDNKSESSQTTQPKKQSPREYKFDRLTASQEFHALDDYQDITA
jgi:hypothetical protein